MSIVVIVTFKAAEGHYNDLKQLIEVMLPQTSVRPGCELLRGAGNPETSDFTIYEEWDSTESHQAYRKWSGENRDPAKLVSLLREPPQSVQLEKIF